MFLGEEDTISRLSHFAVDKGAPVTQKDGKDGGLSPSYDCRRLSKKMTSSTSLIGRMAINILEVNGGQVKLSTVHFDGVKLHLI